MTFRRPIWFWGAAGLVCLAGVLAGPLIYVVVTTVWTAFQPRSFVSGWDVIALVALFGLIWLGAVCVIARGLHGKAAVAFVVTTVTVAGATVLYERLHPPTEVTTFTLTGDEAAAWRDYRP